MKTYDDIIEDFKNIYENLEGNEFLLLDAKFGKGKSYFLDIFIEKYLEDKRVLKSNLYNEYLENNYVEYLRRVLFQNQNNFKKFTYFFNKFKYELMLILIPIFILAILFLFLIFLNLFVLDYKISYSILNVSSYILFIVEFIGFIYLLFRRFNINDYTNEIEFIEKNIKDLDLIIIEDLDRCYIKNHEILKMLDFFKNIENCNCKFILVGDSLAFKDELHFEKYSDFIFKLPEDILLNKMKVEIKKLIYLNNEYEKKGTKALLEIISNNNYTYRIHEKIKKKFRINNGYDSLIKFQKFYILWMLYVDCEKYKNIINCLEQPFLTESKILNNDHILKKLNNRVMTEIEKDFLKNYIFDINYNSLKQFDHECEKFYHTPIFHNVKIYEEIHYVNTQFPMENLEKDYKNYIKNDFVAFYENYSRNIEFFIDKKKEILQLLDLKIVEVYNIFNLWYISDVYLKLYFESKYYQIELILNSKIPEDIKAMTLLKRKQKGVLKLEKIKNNYVKIIYINYITSLGEYKIDEFNLVLSNEEIDIILNEQNEEIKFLFYHTRFLKLYFKEKIIERIKNIHMDKMNECIDNYIEKRTFDCVEIESDKKELIEKYFLAYEENNLDEHMK